MCNLESVHDDTSLYNELSFRTWTRPIARNSVKFHISSNARSKEPGLNVSVES